MLIYVITNEIKNKMNKKKFCTSLKILTSVLQQDIREQHIYIFFKTKNTAQYQRGLDYDPIPYSSHCQIHGLRRDRTWYVEHVFNVFFSSF